MTQPKTTGDDAAPSQELEELRAQLVALEAERDKWKDSAARAQADLQNAKARVEREDMDRRKFAVEQMVVRLLPTLDNFRRAFAHVPEEVKEQEWMKGFAAIEQDLARQMTDAGVKRMDALNQPVDPHRHEILLTGPGPMDTVIEVLDDGYELHGKILRPAKVKVGDGSK